MEGGHVVIKIAREHSPDDGTEWLPNEDGDTAGLWVPYGTRRKRADQQRFALLKAA